MSSGISKQACVTLQRPAPLTFTFDKTLLLFSTMMTFKEGFILAAFTAQKNPAAPPPITTSEEDEFPGIHKNKKLVIQRGLVQYNNLCSDLDLIVRQLL